MELRPTTIERAYQLAMSGSCPTTADIKLRLRKEGYDEKHLFGRTLLTELRRLCGEATLKAS